MTNRQNRPFSTLKNILKVKIVERAGGLNTPISIGHPLPYRGYLIEVAVWKSPYCLT